MSEEATTQEEPKEPEETSAPESSPEPQLKPGQVVMTQEEINSIVAREVAKATRKTKRELKAQMAEDKNQPESNPELSADVLTPLMEKLEALESKLSQQESEKDFEAAVAGVQMTDQQRQIAKALHGKSEFSVFLEGIKGGQPPPPKGETPYNSPGGPSPQPGVDRGDPPWKWSGEDVAALKRDGKLLEKLKEWRKAQGGNRLFPAKK